MQEFIPVFISHCNLHVPVFLSFHGSSGTSLPFLYSHASQCSTIKESRASGRCTQSAKAAYSVWQIDIQQSRKTVMECILTPQHLNGIGTFIVRYHKNRQNTSCTKSRKRGYHDGGLLFTQYCREVFSHGFALPANAIPAFYAIHCCGIISRFISSVSISPISIWFNSVSSRLMTALPNPLPVNGSPSGLPLNDSWQNRSFDPGMSTREQEPDGGRNFCGVFPA